MIAVAAHPRVVVSFTRDRSALARALEALEPNDGPTRLSLGVELARSTASGGGSLEIDVFTDLPSEAIGVSPSAGERLRYFRFGRSDDNVALAALRVYQNPFQDPQEARGYALVKNYAREPKDLTLHVMLASRPVLDDTLHLGGRESRVVAIPKLGDSGRLEAWLDVSDALAVDNRALAFVRPARRIRVLAVTDNAAVRSDLAALVRAVPTLDVRTVVPQEFRNDDSAGADVAIFHAFVPTDPPPVNTLYSYPPPGNGFLHSAPRDVVGAQILDWNDADPILHEPSRALRGAEVVKSQVKSRDDEEGRDRPRDGAGGQQRVEEIERHPEQEKAKKTLYPNQPFPRPRKPRHRAGGRTEGNVGRTEPERENEEQEKSEPGVSSRSHEHEKTDDDRPDARRRDDPHREPHVGRDRFELRGPPIGHGDDLPAP